MNRSKVKTVIAPSSLDYFVQHSEFLSPAWNPQNLRHWTLGYATLSRAPLNSSEFEYGRGSETEPSERW